MAQDKGSCRFSIVFQGDAQALVERARQALEDAGGTFAGGAQSGSYAVPTPLGTIAGTYTITGQAAAFVVTRKPLLLSCARIEKELRNLLAQAVQPPRQALAAEPGARAVECRFDLPYQGTAQALVDNARRAVEDAGGSFTGDAQAGSFSLPTPLGRIVGNYGIEGQTLRLEITRKPLLVSCQQIEARLAALLGAAAVAAESAEFVSAKAAKCRFSVPFEGSAEALVERARVALAQAGGSFNGSARSGSFVVPTPVGRVAGTYVIPGPTISVEITDKPFLVGCGKIEETFKELLEQ